MEAMTISVLNGETDGYDCAFANSMTAAGLTPTLPMAIAVSGGPDSTALCILASRWVSQNGGSPCSLLGFIVDHGLRDESALEASIVQSRMSALGIRCEVLKCSWPIDMPKQGHLQEEARNNRYELIHKACKRSGAKALLTAHHLDDQIELFIIRFTRKSGLAGLACMPFTSNLYRCMVECSGKAAIHALLLVRPLLGLSKNDLYQVCRKHDVLWVEDPTNKKPIYFRNVVRSILSKPEFTMLKKEVPSLISLCRKMRSFSDQSRDLMLSQCVSVDADFGYVTVNLERVKHVKIMEEAVKRMLVAILQFVAQKEKPPRGSVVQTLVDFVNSDNLKGALTLAGCNIYVDQRTTRSQIIICTSSDSKLPERIQPVNIVWTWDPGTRNESDSFQQQVRLTPMPTCSISRTDMLDNEIFQTKFMKVQSTSDLLNVAKESNMLSDMSDIALHKLLDEFSLRSPNHEMDSFEENKKQYHNKARKLAEVEIPSGHACYFMNRFWISWGMKQPHIAESGVGLLPQAHFSGCRFLRGGSSIHSKRTLGIRYMEEKDWQFIFQLTRKDSVISCLKTDGCEESEFYQDPGRNKLGGSKENSMTKDLKNTLHALPCCSGYLLKIAQSAATKLKNIPVPVRRALPVFVTNEGALISIPSLGFSMCANIWVLSRFCPRIPLGGGHVSWS
ncbi:hypothetical protein KP509_26G019300 [Ceratopteris richardii]|uniref:tRNA(Ile)-lysidine synthetase n=1 Tax=Ceratopteris richardii TaxID=49495 RepID=A0A8T2RIX2_CERRI|nr:hypothetical protein KP509_26G019300 [Ceratopteris richardii]